MSNTQDISGLAYQIVFYAILNSIIVYGILCTVDKLLDPYDTKDENSYPPIIGVSVTYLMGILMGLMLKTEYITEFWHRILFGISIATTSVALYKSVIKSLLELVPRIMDRLFGGNK